MKLRNKKTGEVKEWDFGNWYQHIINPNDKESYECTLSEFIDRTAEFREDWEDYEEPKEYWYIEPNGVITRIDEWDACTNSDIEIMKSLGNYFETREEAEKAVEKLKAWKRLKDKGFMFTDYDYTTYNGKGCGQVFFNGVSDNINEIKADLDLLFVFGGEE